MRLEIGEIEDGPVCSHERVLVAERYVPQRLDGRSRGRIAVGGTDRVRGQPRRRGVTERGGPTVDPPGSRGARRTDDLVAARRAQAPAGASRVELPAPLAQGGAPDAFGSVMDRRGDERELIVVRN
jgi:hypothetical protein